MKNEYIPKTLKKTVFTNNPKIGYEINFRSLISFEYDVLNEKVEKDLINGK